jgi:peroxiredoxin
VFYLGYACNACVHDLFELNADVERFRSLGAEVVAVSGDAPDLTRRRYEEFGAFAFPVLSDPGHAVARSYGTSRPAKGSGPGELVHGTFLTRRDGRVHWAHRGDTPFRNNKALLYELARLEDRLPQPGPAGGAGAKETKEP